MRETIAHRDDQGPGYIGLPCAEVLAQARSRFADDLHRSRQRELQLKVDIQVGLVAPLNERARRQAAYCCTAVATTLSLK